CKCMSHGSTPAPLAHLTLSIWSGLTFLACNLQGVFHVLANGAGENLGIGMTGGAIYLRGEARSVAPDLRVERMRDADSMRLSLLLARAGVRGDIKEFKLYRPRGN
ncbi:MAG: hypothetical protein AAF394_06785, partial [Planctomycetota bacterium]